MPIKITSQQSLWRMQNAITQANKAFGHNIESGIKAEWELACMSMRRIHKVAIERNEKYKEMKR